MKTVLVEAEEPPSATPRRQSPSKKSFIQTTPAPTLAVAAPVRRIRPEFKVSERSAEFLRRHYPDATVDNWNDWRWQNRYRVRTLADLERMIRLSDEETDAIRRHAGALPVGITPYYASLLDSEDSLQGLRRSVVPVLGEYIVSRGENEDPLGEDSHSPVPGLVHRYPDRVLLLVTNFCSVYCRYCTRARMVGSVGERSVKKGDIELALDYIARTPVIRDVLISGGDPLSLDDDRLDYILGRLRKIPHVEFVRIGSKQPVVQPMRITRALTRVLKRYHPLWMSLHFTHPDELTPEVAEACGRLADAGIPLGSQTVLLKDVNDDLDTMKSLMQGLLRIRVKPYYLYQCDPISGSGHFRTPVSKGVELIRGLRGHTTGYAVPTFVVDAPNGGGKIPVSPDYVVGYEGSDLLLTSYDGGTYRYPDSGERLHDSHGDSK
ncbi:MAG: KamA family radical SAM protein [Gammaproteobacteria bacterium]|nr:KamA family radical SAM protein [Gammaproteobacteria bacterium]MDH4253499.1 KamA family radical SAM protein [Gammaproteobacteria bacterium]MDH5309732.1 KamA family radical SAM protein [Gammaproteobacteria bacterium]